EARMLDAEVAALFTDAALAQKQRLPPGGQRPADDGPFFESDPQPAHPGHLQNRRTGVSPVPLGEQARRLFYAVHPGPTSPLCDRKRRSFTAVSGSHPSYSTRWIAVVIGMSRPICRARS